MNISVKAEWADLTQLDAQLASKAPTFPHSAVGHDNETNEK